MKLSEFLISNKLAIGFAEIRRMCTSNIITVNNVPVKDIHMELNTGDRVEIGKRKLTV